MHKIFSLLLTLLFLVLSVNASDMRFIQVDGMMYDKNSSKNFKNLIEKINKEKKVEFVIFSGNNLARPNKSDLLDFIHIANDLNCPYYFTLGNKDVNKQKKLSKQEYFKILKKKVKSHKKIKTPNYVFIKNKTVFIVVDGAKDVIPMSFGYYKADTLDWLEKQLTKYKNKNVVILQHFPIVPPSKKETSYTYKPDEYLKLLSKYNNVKAVISGHFNTNNEIEHGNIIHISTANAPQYRIIDILDYETTKPVFWSVIKE